MHLVDFKRASKFWPGTGGSYLSSHDLWEVLGIGAASQLDELEIRWPAPSKRVDKFANVAPNRYIHIIEGKGML